MGFTPGDTDGQGNTVKFWSRRMSTVVRSGVVVLKNLSLSLSDSDDLKEMRLEYLVAIPLCR